MGVEPQPPDHQSDAHPRPADLHEMKCPFFSWGKAWKMFPSHLLFCTIFTQQILTILVRKFDLVRLEFNGPVYNIKVMSSPSVYLTTLFLSKLSPLSGWPVLYTFFCQKLTTTFLETAEVTEWLKKIFHNNFLTSWGLNLWRWPSVHQLDTHLTDRKFEQVYLTALKGGENVKETQTVQTQIKLLL